MHGVAYLPTHNNQRTEHRLFLLCGIDFHGKQYSHRVLLYEDVPCPHQEASVRTSRRRSEDRRYILFRKCMDHNNRFVETSPGHKASGESSDEGDRMTNSGCQTCLDEKKPEAFGLTAAATGPPSSPGRGLHGTRRIIEVDS